MPARVVATRREKEFYGPEETCSHSIPCLHFVSDCKCFVNEFQTDISRRRRLQQGIRDERRDHSIKCVNRNESFSPLICCKIYFCSSKGRTQNCTT